MTRARIAALIVALTSPLWVNVALVHADETDAPDAPLRSSWG